MKLADLMEGDAPRLRQDNPGGTWLKHERDRAAEGGTYPSGVPKRFGELTGSWSRPVLLPVELLKNIPGMKEEQKNVHEPSLTWLVKYMGEKNELPTESLGQYPPFIMVNQDGKAWVSEGNHRIMAAAKLKWEYLPTEARYFAGGELEDGQLSPEKVKKHDAEAQSKGYSPKVKGEDSFKGVLK